MKIYQGLARPISISNPIVTTGTFDGVHAGHHKIIERLKSLATEHDGETVLVTFNPHPRTVIFPDDNELRLLSTPEERIQLLEKAGIQHLVVVEFNRDFSRMGSEQWIQLLSNQLKMHTLVIGYDHHFGRNREGSIDQLRKFASEFNFNLEQIPAQDIDDIKVSSTKVRNALLQGDIKLANSFLTYPYAFTGVVVKGDQRGRTIGYPTANLMIQDKLKLIPSDGVYAIHAMVDNKMHQGMLNIGFRPTVDGKKHAIEAHLFNLDRDLYGKTITVELMGRIRNEQKFNSIEELKKQLGIDAVIARQELNPA